ncbi:MAG: alpha-hydroxy-acid oxidizing protein [Clostridiales bacterium]|nr:alpha-hydroxy-acid oxidizing protein [Clostridiales bacterium]
MSDEKARKLMGNSCKVCPVCNGVACAGQIPGMGGTGTGEGFINNFTALKNIKLNMKVLNTFSIPNTEVEFLDFNLSFPVIGAPVASVDLNMGGGLSEEIYIDSFMKGCFDAGVLGSTGDGLEDFVYQAGFKAIKNVEGFGIPFIKPWEDKIFYKKLNDALISGAKVIGIDIDAIGLTVLRKFGLATKMRTHEELKTLIDSIPVPVILKGILSPEEAVTAIQAGASAIVVSNHGGRILDSCPSTAQVLPQIVKAVDKQIPILVDGGVRSGEDILKMIALGADAVMIGRPVAISVFKDTESGVRDYLVNLKDQFEKAMILTGCHSVDEIDSRVIYKERRA